MAYQTTTTTGYGTRLSNAFRGIGAGVILLIVATVLLFWNEGRTVKTSKMLKEAQKVCVHVDDVSTLDPDLSGRVIHATALADTRDSLYDGLYGVGARAIRLSRNVEYYQWREQARTQTRDKVGGGQEKITTYTYSKEWCGEPVNSGSFSDPAYQGSNFVLKTVEDDVQYAENVRFGAYRLSPGQIRRIGGEKPVLLAIPDDLLAEDDAAIARIKVRSGGAAAAAAALPDTAGVKARNGLSYVHTQNNVLYLGASPSAPEIGDVRITYTKVEPATVSIIAQVAGDTFEPFTARSGYTLSTLEMGAVGMDSMFSHEHSRNNVLKWILRLLGFLLVFYGLKNILGILVALLKVIPFLAGIVNLATSVVLGVVAFAWTLLVIAVAWLFYRPVLGIALLAVGGAALWYFSGKGARLKAEAGEAVIPGSAEAAAEGA